MTIKKQELILLKDMECGKMQPIEKAKDFKGSMSKLIKYSSIYKVPIIIAIIFSMASSILTIIGPNKLSEMTDEITKGFLGVINMDNIIKIAVTLLIIYIVSAILGYLQGYIMAIISQKISQNLRRAISNKINKVPLKYFDKVSYGNTLSIITNDIDTVGQTLNQSIGNLINSVTTLIGVIIMMFVTNWQMSISAIIASMIGFILMVLILAKSQKYFVKQQEGLGTINGHIEEMYTGHNVVEVYNGKKEAKEIFDKYNEELFTSARKSQFLSGIMHPVMGFIGNLAYVTVCVVGAILTMKGIISFGVIVAFMIYVRLYTGPLTTIAQAFSSLQTTAAASERVFEFLEEEELFDESNKTKKIDSESLKGDIKFDNIKFGYDNDKMIIKNFSANVKAGQKIAIVGPTGAGKTTIVNLLMRFYELNSGDIRIDGISEKDLKRENIHDLFCMVLQDTWLFEGTIKENIVYNKKGISDEQIEEACKAVGLHHFINTLPKKYDTVLTDNESLSAGQKQLLTIARAMIKDSPFLILDEATSSVDTRTEELVQKAMDKLTKGRTSFIIAHRLSTIRNADLILVINEGNIIEQGNHEELMKQNGFYANLYNSQFEKLSA